MTVNDDNQGFVNAAKQAFDASVEQLDESTISAIGRCRSRAFERSADRNTWLLLPAGVVATLALAAVLVFTISQQEVNGLYAEDLEMLSSSESLEFYEDLEFYLWLDENDLAS